MYNINKSPSFLRKWISFLIYFLKNIKKFADIWNVCCLDDDGDKTPTREGSGGRSPHAEELLQRLDGFMVEGMDDRYSPSRDDGIVQSLI